VNGKRFGMIAAAIAILAATTNAGLAQSATTAAKPKPSPAQPAPAAAVTHPPVAAPLVAPTRNAIGLPTPSPAANTIGAAHGPGPGSPNVAAAKPGPVGTGGVRPDAQHAPASPLTAKVGLSGSQMGRPTTGAAMLGGSATHAPSAVIGHSNASVKH
jgi:hypothetical protein